MNFRCTALLSIALMLIAVASSIDGAASEPQVRIGSKKFTESVILAEIAAKLCGIAGAEVIKHQELGGTRLLWDALVAGEIDLYPEYKGTLAHEILKSDNIESDASLADALAKRGLRMSESLGFSNRYAFGMMQVKAENLQIRTISDLTRHPTLRFGLSDEFLNRSDGWPALRIAYGLSESNVRGIDHEIAYKGLVDGSIDVIDLYATDAEINLHKILVLDDDRHYFSDNQAILIYRVDIDRRAPAALASVLRLQGKIDTRTMIAMNAAVKIDRRTESDVASQFIQNRFGLASIEPHAGIVARILQRTIEHLRLTSLSLAAAILIALPLGVIAAKRPPLGRVILAAVSIMQTIPSLALLVFMIPILGIGAPPAIAALFFYSLLPIVRNTALGITNIPASIRSSAIAIGLTPAQRLRLIELPMASPAILDGVKTAAVINVGTATLGALIGAGGYGQPIFTGVRLDDFGLILEGAIPAAVLALVVQGLFGLAERRFVPLGLRLKPNKAV